MEGKPNYYYRQAACFQTDLISEHGVVDWHFPETGEVSNH